MAAKQSEVLYQRTRWKLFASLFVGYSFYSWTRKTFTFSIPTIVNNFHLEKDSQYKLGLITSSYTMTYGVSKFMAGFLADGWSARGLFFTGLLLSALVNILIGFYTNLWSLTVLWGMNGLVQGLGWPPCTALLKEWFKPNELGTLWSVLTASTNLTASMLPVVTSFLILHYGLSAAFIIPGALAIIVSLVVYMTIYNSPSEIGLDKYQRTVKPMHVRQNKLQQPTPSIAGIFKCPFFWIVAFGYFSIAFIKFGISDWGQLYLIQEKRMSLYNAGLAMSMFEVGGVLGSVTSGYFSDCLVTKNGTDKGTSSPRMPLLLLYLLGLTVSLFAFHTSITMETPKVMVYVVMLGIGCTALGPINIFGVLAVENSPPGLTSSTHGFVALAASVGATMAGYPLSVFTKYHDWSGMMVLLQVVSLFTLLVLFWTRNISSTMDVQIKNKTS